MRLHSDFENICWFSGFLRNYCHQRIQPYEERYENWSSLMVLWCEMVINFFFSRNAKNRARQYQGMAFSALWNLLSEKCREQKWCLERNRMYELHFVKQCGFFLICIPFFFHSVRILCESYLDEMLRISVDYQNEMKRKRQIKKIPSASIGTFRMEIDVFGLIKFQFGSLVSLILTFFLSSGSIS